MKRPAASDPCGSCHDNARQTTKLPCLGGLNTASASWDDYEEQINPQQPSSPLSPGGVYTANGLDELQHKSTPLASRERQNEIFRWIPHPSKVVQEFDIMARPPSKRPRSKSLHHGQTQLTSSSERSSLCCDTKSSVYHSPNYDMLLEKKNCFMNDSQAGPTKEDTEFCMRLLSEEVATPQNTILDDELSRGFYRILSHQSKVGLLMGLHPLLMPSVQEKYLKEKENRDRLQHLEHVVDGYSDLWVNADPICGPRPKPDHARGLRGSFFSDSEHRKLKTEPNGLSPYAMRYNMWFPYLTAEVKSAAGPLSVADRQNMHSMCIALRALVSLAQAAGQPEKLHRRVLGFSISHDLDHVSIYAHYPEINQGNVAYYRWKLADNGIWEDKWTCYRFVENLDREFLPIHIRLVKELLEKIADPGASPSGVDSYAANTGPGADSGLDILMTLQNTIETLRQQLKQQREDAETRETNLLAQLEKQTREADEREKRLFALLTQKN